MPGGGGGETKTVAELPDYLKPYVLGDEEGNITGLMPEVQAMYEKMTQPGYGVYDDPTYAQLNDNQLEALNYMNQYAKSGNAAMDQVNAINEGFLRGENLYQTGTNDYLGNTTTYNPAATVSGNKYVGDTVGGVSSRLPKYQGDQSIAGEFDQGKNAFSTDYGFDTTRTMDNKYVGQDVTGLDPTANKYLGNTTDSATNNKIGDVNWQNVTAVNTGRTAYDKQAFDGSTDPAANKYIDQGAGDAATAANQWLGKSTDTSSIQTADQATNNLLGLNTARAENAAMGSTDAISAPGRVSARDATTGRNYLAQENKWLDDVIGKAQQDVTDNWKETVGTDLDRWDRTSGSFGNSGVQQMRQNAYDDLSENLGDISSQFRYSDFIKRQDLEDKFLDRQLEAGISNQQTDANIGIANARNALEASLANQAAQQADLNRYANISSDDKALQNQLALANTDSNNLFKQLQAQYSNSDLQRNADLTNSLAISNAANALSGWQSQAGLQNDLSQFNANLDQDAWMKNSDLGLNQAQFMSNLLQGDNQFNASSSLEAQLANSSGNMDAALQQALMTGDLSMFNTGMMSDENRAFMDQLFGYDTSNLANRQSNMDRNLDSTFTQDQFNIGNEMTDAQQKFDNWVNLYGQEEAQRLANLEFGEGQRQYDNTFNEAQRLADLGYETDNAWRNVDQNNLNLDRNLESTFTQNQFKDNFLQGERQYLASLQQADNQFNAGLDQQRIDNALNEYQQNYNTFLQGADLAQQNDTYMQDRLSNLLGIGDTFQTNTQGQLDDNFMKWAMEQQVPLDALELLAGGLSGGTGAGLNTTSSSPGNTYMDILGGGLIAGNMTGLFGGQ